MSTETIINNRIYKKEKTYLKQEDSIITVHQNQLNDSIGDQSNYQLNGQLNGQSNGQSSDQKHSKYLNSKTKSNNSLNNLNFTQQVLTHLKMYDQVVNELNKLFDINIRY